jgi:hypothetical protein
MSVPLVINGVTYNYPQVGDTNWGPTLTAWSTAVTNGMLQKQGGTFTLTNDANFGPSFGLLAAYFKTRAALPASAGLLRLAHTDTIEWRNNGNSADNILTTNGSDQLTYNGAVVQTGSGFVTSITGTANQIIASAATGPVTLSTPQDIATSSTPTFAGANLTNTLSFHRGVQFINLSTPIGLSVNYSWTLPLVQGSAGQFLQNDGSGTLSWANAAGSGTINTGAVGQVAFYTGSTAVSGATAVVYNSSTHDLTLTNGNLTLNGIGKALTLTGVGGNQVVIAASTSAFAATRNYTVIDAGADANFVMTEGAQTLNGAKTLTNLNGTLGSDLAAGSHKVTGLAAATTAGDAISYRQGGQAVDGSTANSGGSSGTVQQGTISTPDLRANAVTQQVSTLASTFGWAEHSAGNVTITTIGKPVMVTYSCTVSVDDPGANAPVFYASIFQDSTEIAGGQQEFNKNSGTNLNSFIAVSGTTIITPSAGSHTYDLSVVRRASAITTAATVTNVTIIAIELRA